MNSLCGKPMLVYKVNLGKFDEIIRFELCDTFPSKHTHNIRSIGYDWVSNIIVYVDINSKQLTARSYEITEKLRPIIQAETRDNKLNIILK